MLQQLIFRVSVCLNEISVGEGNDAIPVLARNRRLTVGQDVFGAASGLLLRMSEN
jgi:hypothetical protein